MSSITIPGSVTQIGNLAFQHCSASLTSIMVDDSNPVYDSRENCNAIIETASNKLLYGCSNTKIPKGVTEIDSGAFLECKNLTRITIPDSVKKIGNAAFYFCTDLTSVNIPESVKEINFQAFYVCRGLTSITIPKSVESIDSQAFAACSGLTSIKVASENPVYDSRENCNAIINTADNELIVGCKNTKIPDNVTKIGGRAFEGCDELVSIRIPDGVTSIENAAFSFCDSLTSIMIPQSVTYIDDNVFGYSEQFQTIRGYSGSYAETYAKENGYTFVDLNAPAVPTVTNVKAVPAGKNKVNVTWNKVNGATGYIVYAKKNGKYAKLGVTAATSYTDKAALDNDYNFYFVYAYKKDSAGKIVVGKCQKYAYAKGTCKAVTNLKASSIKGGVKLTWTKSVGADGYIIYGKHPGGTYGYVGMTSKNTATSFTDKGADKKNYNFYWVFPYHNKNGKRVIGPICGYVYGKAK